MNLKNIVEWKKHNAEYSIQCVKCFQYTTYILQTLYIYGKLYVYITYAYIYISSKSILKMEKTRQANNSVQCLPYCITDNIA